MIKSIPLNTVFHSPKHRAADNAKRLITLTNLSHFKQTVGNLSPFKSLPGKYVEQYSVDMQVSLDCISSCLEWVCRVNQLDAIQLRMLAIVNIMAGVLYETDSLTELALEEIEHLHKNPHSVDTYMLEEVLLSKEVPEWDRPAIRYEEAHVIQLLAPELSRCYLDQLEFTGDYEYMQR
jgi:hypothetical protein